MQEGRPSETAMLAAIMRAAHPIVDSKPWILNDHMAAALVGIDSEQQLLAALESFRQECARRLPPAAVQSFINAARAGVTARARYVEDELAKAIERGVSQYVILGAGFDSFAYRRSDMADKLRIFEVDYAATQHRKRARLQQMQVKIPHNVAFVAVDFERQRILSALEAAGCRLGEPGLFSWLGVTFYLTEPAFESTLTQIAAAAVGSEVVFDYMVPLSMLDEQERQIRQVTSEQSMARRGEPRRCDFEPASLVARLADLGFADVLDLGPEQMNARYFTSRTDGLRFGTHMHVIKARVGRAGD